MEMKPRPKSVKDEAERIITLLLAVAEGAYGRKRPGQVLPDEVKKWWMMHYRSKFYYAIDGKELKYLDSEEQLTAAATFLGEALANGAASPTREDAAKASFLVDCREEDEPTTSFVKWCN